MITIDRVWLTPTGHLVAEWTFEDVTNSEIRVSGQWYTNSGNSVQQVVAAVLESKHKPEDVVQRARLSAARAVS